MEGYITDIQRFSVHDGPGIRTTVFLKGCNLHCIWCHNPETIQPRPELQLFPDKCIGCGECLRRCPVQAHYVVEGVRKLRRDLCRACGACAKNCYAGALVLMGKRLSVAAVLTEIEADREFYETSDGGVTISGGEPFYQRNFTYELLKLCKEKGIPTALETNLAWPWETVESVLPVTDLMMVDLKIFDSAKHQKYTGCSNETIRRNAQNLAHREVPLIIRTPVIPGINDTAAEIENIARFIAQFSNLRYYELLPYHPLGTGKYQSLGLDYQLEGVKRPVKQEMETLAGIARGCGIPVRCTGI